MMKFAVVDVQGFCISDFFPKELAIYDGKQMKSYVFKPSIPFHALNEDCKRQVRYLYRNHHGIHYNQGDYYYEDIYSIVYQDLRDIDIVYVKGEMKREFLVKLFLEMKFKSPSIVNLEYNNVPNLKKTNITECTNHNLR